MKVPIILYNLVGRTGKNIEPELMAKLAQDCKNIVGVKEASGSLEQMQRIREVCPKDFILLSGDDALTLPLLAIGGVGVISVAANIVPKDVVGVINAFNKGDLKMAQAINAKLQPLIRALFVETNPIPVKTACELMGLCSSAMRLPLCPMEDVTPYKAALRRQGEMLQKQSVTAVACRPWLCALAREQAGETDSWRVIERLRERNAHMDPDEAWHDATSAVAEARQEYRG